ncbi:caspase family protein [Pantanalinema rosaneae CENA516]|uniref:caspase family protein n=1 Tax=Pantanalinema rosaneae TaxID=1620701 RepID=UPI003D6E00F6
MTETGIDNPEPARSSRDRWALLVGINTYIDPHFSPLKFCVNDVQVLEQTLSQLGYTVVCLHDQQTDQADLPTRDNVEDALVRLCQTVREDDLLFVHFACHGKLVDRTPFLITQDTRYHLLAKRALSVAEVEDYMRNSQAKQLVLSLDACHTGVEVGRDVTDPEFLHNVYDLATGFALIAASTSQQKAQEWQEKQHGVYTYYLMEGLRGAADRSNKALVTVRDVQEYVTDRLRHWAIQSGGLIQEPTVRLDGIGDMILADYRKTPINLDRSTLPEHSQSSSRTTRDSSGSPDPTPMPSNQPRLKSPKELQREQLERDYTLKVKIYETVSHEALYNLNPAYETSTILAAPR